MATVQADKGCTTDIEKLYTSYTWSLNDWDLLYDIYHSTNIESPQFPIADTEECKCRLILSPNVIHDGALCACVRVEFSDIPNYQFTRISVSFVDEKMKLLFPKCSSMHPSSISNEKTEVHVPINLAKGCTQYLTNDTLIIFAEIAIVKSISTAPLLVKTHVENFPASFFKNLGRLQDGKSLQDVTLVIGDKKLFAHKLILAAHSEVFRAMFTSGMQEERESTVRIIDIDATVFEEFLGYMYSGKVNNLDSIVDEIIVVADKYQVHDLKVLCENTIASRLDTENVIEYLITADKHCHKILKLKALEFVKANMRVFEEPAKYKMLLDHPTLIKEVFAK